MRPRNPVRQMVGLTTVAIALFVFIGWVGSMLDPSTPEQRACITKKGAQEFMTCVREKARQ